MDHQADPAGSHPVLQEPLGPSQVQVLNTIPVSYTSPAWEDGQRKPPALELLS